MTRHLTRRTPQRSGGFSWGRVLLSDTTVTYRLFRRDHSGHCHFWQLTFDAAILRRSIANDLRRARHKLRDKVDEIDLDAMGVTA
ncbi:hypothetical protein [Xanthomonas translucens]|uniref:hypothetical protein n=1 Tax=Xanthomonas campestris pv. translucens TaxID=343 RepID=UPI00071B59D3|nr:hypothetical protein [Xanthomonas translucens]AVY67203.1 hypothetical protein NZ30_13010 [Xanthomonas translucens pv. undulosa]MCT8281804.1 hypothetical protein [Xanthomonas translucens pv. undulosa]MCT8316442.1 hypothetical protein [Xanthomonas translucens pv. undulosa]UKE38314.1 hypothetical protein KCU58_11120 [Xanthomonas translucens pv. undulosa]